MPRVSDAHRASRRDQILDAALECFAQRGVRATTMADIIAASGLSAGAIYGYFEGKQELALAVMRRVVAGRSADVDAAAGVRPPSPGGILRALNDGFIREGIDPSILVQLWGEAANDPEFHEIARRAFGAVEGMFATHLGRWATTARGMDPAAGAAWAIRMVPVLLGLAQGLIVQETILPGFDREAFLAAVDEVFHE